MLKNYSNIILSLTDNVITSCWSELFAKKQRPASSMSTIVGGGLYFDHRDLTETFAREQKNNQKHINYSIT